MTTGHNDLLKAAAKVAAGWNHHWVGTEHILVAYLEAERKDEVNPFLTDAGLKFDAAETYVKEAVPPRDEREEGKDGVIHTPRVARICGFAEGWAAASWGDVKERGTNRQVAARAEAVSAFDPPARSASRRRPGALLEFGGGLGPRGGDGLGQLGSARSTPPRVRDHTTRVAEPDSIGALGKATKCNGTMMATDPSSL